MGNPRIVLVQFATVPSPVQRSKTAVEWRVGDWRGTRSGGYARSLWGVGVTGSGARTHRAITSSVSVHCCEPSPANEKRHGRPRTKGVDGWRWLHDGCSGPGTEAHTQGHRRVVWSRRSNFFETAAGARKRRPWVERVADVTAKCGRATACDGQQDLNMCPTEPLTVALEESSTCGTDQVGHLQGRPSHLSLRL
jgi:hypothetical protein